MNTAWKVGLTVAGVVVVGLTAVFLFGDRAKATVAKEETKPEDTSSATAADEQKEVPASEEKEAGEPLVANPTVLPLLERMGKSVKVTEVKVKRSGISESAVFRAYNRMCRQLFNKLPFHGSPFETEGQIIYLKELTSYPSIGDVVVSPRRYINRVLKDKGCEDPADMFQKERPLVLYVIERNRTNTVRPILIVRDGGDYYLLGMRDRDTFIFSEPEPSEMKERTGADIFPLLLEMFKPLPSTN